jgi:hypothetical protein
VKKNLIRAAFVGFSAIALTLGITTAASAGTDGPQVCNSSPNTSCVKFYNNGDIIRVWDTDCDNHGAVAHVWAPEQGIYNNFFYTGGCGTYGEYPYGTSMDEDQPVYYQACSSISSVDHTYEHCSGIGGGRS